MGAVGALFITGLVIYFIGWLLGFQERADTRRWFKDRERERLDLPPLPPPRFRFSIRGCLWSMVLIPAALLALGTWLSTFWR